MFRELGEAELCELEDGALVDYALRAREAGEEGCAERALRIFAFGMEDALRAFVRNKMDSHGDAVIEEIAERTLEDAIRSIVGLRGATTPQARAFVFRIARRRIADHYRAGRVQTTPLEDAEEAQLGRGPGRRGHDGSLQEADEAGAVETRIVLEQALERLRPEHRLVVERFVLNGHSAREAADLANRRFEGDSNDSMTEQNVHQIGSRFRRDLRDRLEEAQRGA